MPVPNGSFARPHAHRVRSQTAANSPGCASTHGCHAEFAPGMGASTGTRARRGLCSHPSYPCVPLCGRYGVGAQPRLGRRVARAVRQEETTRKNKTNLFLLMWRVLKTLFLSLLFFKVIIFLFKKIFKDELLTVIIFFVYRTQSWHL